MPGLLFGLYRMLSKETLEKLLKLMLLALVLGFLFVLGAQIFSGAGRG